MYNTGFQVEPLSREAIRIVSQKVRSDVEKVNGGSSNYFDIVSYLDIILPTVDERFRLEICSKEEMGDNHGLTTPSDHLIQIRTDGIL